MKHIRFTILLIVLVLIFFTPEIISRRGFFYSDNLSARIPTLTFFKQEVLSRRLPLWNPYILGGIPFFADLSNNTFAPTNIFYILLPVPIALNALIIVYISLASIFTYLFVFLLTKKETSSLFAAITFAFSGSVMVMVNDINSLQGIALIPTIFYTAQRFIEKEKANNLLFLIGALSLQFISSHPQYSYYTWLIVIPYLVFFLKGSLTRKLVKVSVLFLTTFSLIAVQLIPFLELTANVVRPSTAEFANQNKLQIIELPRLVLANFYGTWKEGSSWGPETQLESGLATTDGYLGIAPLILAIVASLSVKTKKARFWVAVAILSFIMSLGNQTPFFELLRRFIPLFSKFRSPIRILSVYSFALAILASFGLRQVEEKLVKK